MQTVSREVLARWQVRKTKKQKRAFEAFLLRALREAGYADARAEECGALLKNRNLIVGNPDTAKVIFTAHYDTCAVLPVPNYITPTNLLVWIFYQLLLVLGMFLCATVLAALIWLLPLSEAALFGASTLMFVAVLCLDDCREGEQTHCKRQYFWRSRPFGGCACDAGGTAQRGGVRLVRQ